MNFKVGNTCQISQVGLRGVKFYKIHILAIVDKNQIIYKWYGQFKQWWHYEIKEAQWLKFDIELAKEKKKNLEEIES